MPHERLEDVLHEAFTELTLHGDIYLADFAETLSPGLGRGPVKALFKLRRLGPLRIKDLAVHLRLDSTTVSRHVDDLVRRGLVVREPDTRDGRATLVHLSARAVELLDDAEVERRGKLRDGLQDWSPSDRATFVRLLSRFVQRDDLAATVAAITYAHPDPRDR
ncbi:MarR family transcriptional regulator [Nocardioides sp.]|uniref:MarR family winged helix-turn-helix transcriptional regulator n=1 Tax=Nocardioides sp. TaxID=35761 RepID=UPI00260026FC|nr:MarR family transcriptional regulator [Nocardioides sp.]